MGGFRIPSNWVCEPYKCNVRVESANDARWGVGVPEYFYQCFSVSRGVFEWLVSPILLETLKT